MKQLVWVWLAIAMMAGTAHAHQTSVKYLTLDTHGTRVDVTFKATPADVVEPAAPFVQGWLRIAQDGRTCTPSAPHDALDPDGKFVVVTWTATCPERIFETLTLDLHAFFALDRRHEIIATADGVTRIIRAANDPLELQLGERAPFSAWIYAGVDHIWSGVDHIAFLLALLIVVMLRRDPAGGWTLHRPLAALRRTASVVTAFTVAHSISLILASLGYVTLPSQVVECAIAVSIVYTAGEDVIRPDVRTRFVLTFAFGLVHGLGFASVLSELLPPDDVIVPLLGFNLGVELGQLAIVAVALPALFGLASVVGARPYRDRVMPLLAAAIGLLGLVFLVERVFSLKITGM
jgi:hypothetical protein